MLSFQHGPYVSDSVDGLEAVLINVHVHRHFRSMNQCCGEYGFIIFTKSGRFIYWANNIYVALSYRPWKLFRLVHHRCISCRLYSVVAPIGN